MAEGKSKTGVVKKRASKREKCEMVSHEMVDGNPQVQRTTFADGTKVTVDFEKQTYNIEVTKDEERAG